ncbi:uncharacterized protein LOC100891534 isoform X1 [Strongylocentrotus purpuratus]|uniref:Uncharacterized protein n=1 Tax=Strongylocentrotus purpuratus TaxID=7668 RepID=A0A7M7T1V7_STRPU|nr:uncharacterized protein LOC100891534 isoform X1 [Strongylocentrotus purpuratus]
MNMPSFTMGQTENEDFPALASTSASQPLNFAHQDFNPGKVASQSPHKQRSPGREQPGRPSTPFPENEVQFVPTFHTMAPDHQPLDGIDLDNPGSVDGSYSAPDAMGATPTLNQANLCFSGHSGDALHHHQPHHQQPGPLFFSQEQAWPPESHKLYYSQSLDLDTSSALHRTNPFVTGQRSASCDASQGSTTPTSPVEKDERIPNSAVRRSRVWKYGRRSSGNHSDRQPFTFSVSASQAGSGAIGGIDHSSTRFFGKRSMSSTRHDESWSYEPTTKQFISEERMTAEMHNLSLDGVARQPMIPPPSSSTPSSPSLSSSNLSSAAPSMNLPSTSGQCNHGSSSSNLLRHHRCHHNHRSRTYAEAVLADIERRLDNDSDDEGVEEDMPPNQGDGHRLEMTPQLVTALKCKGASSHMLPQDIVKKIVSSPCMDLVLWRPLSVLNPRLGPDPSLTGPLSPSSSGGSELAPIMEVEVERERAEASSMMQQQPHPYQGIPPAAGDIMQEEALPDFDEDMDL